MSRQEQVPDERRKHTIAVVATFTAMMHAHERGELATAADAQAELSRLGVVVRFVCPKAGRQDGSAKCRGVDDA